MITLTAKIDLVSSGSGTLTNVSTNLSKNNISCDIDDIRGLKQNTARPFIVGVNKVGDGTTISSGVKYFMGKQLSDGNGVFSIPYEINVSGSAITSITLAFDTLNNAHPNTIKIDGVTYYDDDAIFTINGLASANTHTIEIDNWNKAKSSFILSGVYVDISIDLDYSNIISLDSSIFDRSDFKLPSYGIISNTGNLEFNDYNGEVRDYAEQLLLTSDLKVVINLKNTLNGKEEQVAFMETRDWDYDNDNRSVSVSLKDDLEEWQDIYVEILNYDAVNPYDEIKEGSLEYMYKYLFSKTPSKYNMLSFGELSSNTQDILTNTKIVKPLLLSGTLWEQWTKLCKVCGLYIYKNKDNQTICSYTFGS